LFFVSCEYYQKSAKKMALYAISSG